MKNLQNNDCNRAMSVNDIKTALLQFWKMYGCSEIDSYDMPIGAATFHTHTLMSLISPKLRNIMFFQKCRRPQDARGSSGKDRLMRHTQFQVLMTPSPNNIHELVCESLYACGIDRGSLSFVENNWKSPTLGASGKGYEILSNGTEVLQFTYFQKFGNVTLKHIPVELAYGLERVSMLSQKCDDMFDLIYDYSHNNADDDIKIIRYRDVYGLFEDHHACATYDKNVLREMLNMYQKQMLDVGIVGYEAFIMANYVFNLLDASGDIGFFERDQMIGALRKNAEKIINTMLNNDGVNI